MEAGCREVARLKMVVHVPLFICPSLELVKLFLLVTCYWPLLELFIVIIITTTIIILIKETQVLWLGVGGRRFVETVVAESRSYLFLLKDLHHVLHPLFPLPPARVLLPDGCEALWFWPGHQLAMLILSQHGGYYLPIFPFANWRQLSYASSGYARPVNDAMCSEYLAPGWGWRGEKVPSMLWSGGGSGGRKEVKKFIKGKSGVMEGLVLKLEGMRSFICLFWTVMLFRCLKKGLWLLITSWFYSMGNWNPLIISELQLN